MPLVERSRPNWVCFARALANNIQWVIEKLETSKMCKKSRNLVWRRAGWAGRSIANGFLEALILLRNQ
jgi:hypothetical protein